MPTFDTFDRTGAVEFPFAAPVVFRAVEQAIGTLTGMKVQESNKLAGHIYLKTGVSAFSWGEKVTVSVLESGRGRSRVQIASAAKTIAGSATTHGRNRKNVEKIISATSKVLEQNGEQWADELNVASPPNGVADAPASADISVADRLRKIGELHDSGILTDAEYDAKRAELVAQL